MEAALLLQPLLEDVPHPTREEATVELPTAAPRSPLKKVHVLGVDPPVA
jgi:hypothetical protein